MESIIDWRPFGKTNKIFTKRSARVMRTFPQAITFVVSWSMITTLRYVAGRSSPSMLTICLWSWIDGRSYDSCQRNVLIFIKTINLSIEDYGSFFKNRHQIFKYQEFSRNLERVKNGEWMCCLGIGNEVPSFILCIIIFYIVFSCLWNK